MDELLARAEVPSAAVDYATGADGRGKHVAAMLQAIAQFDCELAPLDPPRPSNSKAVIAKAEERKRIEMIKAKVEEDRLKSGGGGGSASASGPDCAVRHRRAG